MHRKNSYIRTLESTNTGKEYENQEEALNKWVFREVLLKESEDMEYLMTRGSLFHKEDFEDNAISDL